MEEKVDIFQAALLGVVGHMIAWPTSRCINLEQGLQTEEIAQLGQCKLLDLSDDDIVVVEGRWQTQDHNALVNGLPLGPKAVKVFLDVVHLLETFIWRPRIDVTYLGDCLKSFVAWPLAKVSFVDTIDTAAGGILTSLAASITSAVTCTTSAATVSKFRGETCLATAMKSPPKKLTSQSPTRRSPRKHVAGVIKEKQKVKLMDVGGKKQVVAERHVHSINPEQMVHFTILGSNAARVWVDIVKVDDAMVWRPSDEIKCMKDALGSSIA